MTPAAATPSREPVCVLVLGMHRSGTSALTRVLNLHGASLGDDLLEPAADNVKGFWEKRAVVLAHERLLVALDRAWRDPRPLPGGWLQSEAAALAAAEVADIVDGFAGEPMFAIKDPRLCELAPLWLPVLRARGIRPVVLFVVRHPLEVAESLHARDGWSRDLSWLMWARSTTAALAATAGVERCVVSYDRLLDDWRAVMARVASQLQLHWQVDAAQAAPAVQEFLDAGERHHHSDEDAGVPGHLLEIYRALLAVEDGAPWDGLDRFADKNEDFRMSTVALHEEFTRPGNQAGARDGGQVQLFYRKGDQVHAEERSRSLPWPHATNVASFDFRFDAPIELDALRIDFDEAPGLFLLDVLEIDGAAVDVMPRLTWRNGTVLGDGVDGTIGLVAADNDPWIEVNLGPTQCRAVTLGITRVPLNDVVQGLRSTFGVQERLGALFERVASSGDVILANQRAARQETGTTLQAHAESIARLEQRLAASEQVVARVDGGLAEAARKLDAIASALAAQAATQQALIGEALGQLGAQAQGQAEAQARHAAALEARLAALDALSAEVTRQREALQAVRVQGEQQGQALQAVAAQGAQQGQELQAIAAVVDEVNRARLGARMRRLFGMTAAPPGA